MVKRKTDGDQWTTVDLEWVVSWIDVDTRSWCSLPHGQHDRGDDGGPNSGSGVLATFVSDGVSARKKIGLSLLLCSLRASEL